MSDPVRAKLLTEIWKRLQCPQCGARLEGNMLDQELRCGCCSSSYPVLAGGIPVMLAAGQRSQFDRMLRHDPDGKRMVHEYDRYGTWKAKVRNWVKPPSIVYDVDVARKYSWIYNTHGEETLVLSIGGGPGRENPRVINLNINAFDSVDLVGDGTNLPLVDASLDTVTANAVIEHVSDPAGLVAEMHRVLKPGGYAQLMIPFVFPFHAYPADYQRYSERGILELMRGFERVELCVLTGPTSAMLVAFREYLRILVPRGNRNCMRVVLNGISGWLTFPFKYLDKWLNRKPEAAHLAAAFYYLGRKPDNSGESGRPGWVP
jgi:SAM-dependent methyltransferase